MPDSIVTPRLEDRIAAVRRFSRFYTRVIGALQEGLLQSPFSLTEARILYELTHHPGLTATTLTRVLGLDAGYLSRILARFAQDGLLERRADETDRRQSALRLTAHGEAAFAPLDAQSRAEVGALLAALPDPAQTELVGAMARIEALLGGMPAPPWHLRGPQPGDIGWVVSRHGALYAAEYGFDARFEALVAQVSGAFLAQHDPARERCWIAQHDGVPVGSVFLVRADDELAKLRLLLVEPTARGLGIGKRLVAECIGFARDTGYRRITLWTNDVLVAARAIYQAAGFRLVASKPHNMFGPAIVGEDWDLTL
ncbi:MAG TPA: helix-turn-helix domain-containing GNAT family N-acetyltransferase [Acetobacteraceae bacterium]